MRTKLLVVNATVAVAFFLTGCASTKFETAGATLQGPLCTTDGQPLSALILWSPVWRSNQKDVPLREMAALQGIEDFAQHSNCFSNVTIRRLPGERAAQVPTVAQIRELAQTITPPPNRVVVLTVHELGPVIQVLGPVATFGGGTEVVLEAQVHDGKSAGLLAKLRAHWSNGGSFVIKGTGTLPKDMRSALDAAFGLPRNDG